MKRREFITLLRAGAAAWSLAARAQQPGTRRSIASLATTAAAALALTSAASAFPDKLLQFVTQYPFGGSHVLHASIITTAAEPHFGQPMISVIRTGGGGVVGADYVLKSAADGHVMLFGDPNLNSLRPQVEQLSFSVGDFIPVARINYSPWVFVAKPDAPFGGTIKGMADWAKANPDKLIYSSDNVNGPTHIVFLLMEQKTGAKMWPLQLGGGGPAIANLLDSNTMAYAGDPSVVGERILGGELKGLCVTDTQRWASLPNVPTCREAGIDIVFHFWRGVLVPKGTPADRVATLSEGFGKLVKDEGFLWLMKAIHSNIAYLDHTTFAEYLTGEQKQLKELYETMKK